MSSLASRPGIQRFSRWVLAVLMLLTVAAVATQRATATHMPADKVVAAGNTLVEITPANEGSPILTSTLRSSSPSDLILQVSLECSLFTRLVTGPSGEGGSDSATAQAKAVVWVTVDDVIVPINDSSQNSTHAGAERDKVTFCDRTYSRTVTDSENPLDGQDTEEDFIRTKSSHAFNWLRLNLGNGIHTIKVWADLTETTVGDATATAVIGNRTLIAEPAKLANDASI